MAKDDTGKPLKRGQKRDHAASRARVRERVRHIADLMAKMEWRAHMAADKAKVWGVAESTVQHYAAEAHRIVEDALADGDALKVGLRECVLETTKEARLAKDFRGAIAGYRLIAEMTGALAKAKLGVEHSGPEGAPLQVATVALLPPLDPSTA